MPINPAVQDMLTRAGVAETEGANNLTRFVSSAMLPFAGGKYVGMVGDAIGAAKAGKLSGQEGVIYLGQKLTPTQIENATPKTSPKLIKEIGITGAELGANKFRIPIENMQADITDLPLRAMKTFDPQKLENGGYILPLWGDMSRGGGIVNEINGTKLANPVRTYGGRDFANENPEAFWASMNGVATKAANYFNSFAEKGEAYPVFTNMGGRSLDSSTMMTDTFLEQLKTNPISKKSSSILDGMVKSAVNKKGVPINADAPSFKTIDDLQTWLRETTLAGREAFIKSIDNKTAHDLGIPDLASTRFAISDQSQIGTPTGYSGTLIGRVDNTGVYTNKPKSPTSAHPGYDTLIGGISNEGGFGIPVPPEKMFPDTIKQLTNAGYEPFRHAYLMQRGAGDIKTVQPITQEYKDSLSAFIENALKENDPYSFAISKKKKGAK
ncbi:MAG: hypothetical protein EBR82_42225 [Caulobacteraceae bacterium]|nr:hypothetical protein [Caulobacteraceae bacterium]